MLQEQGQTLQSIADSLGRSKKSISCHLAGSEKRAHNAGIYSWSSLERDKLAMMRKANLSQDVMVAALPGRDRDAVRKAVESLRGYSPTQLVKRSWSSEEDKELQRLRAQGMSFPQVGLALKRSTQAVMVRWSKCGNPTQPPNAKWTVEEDQILRTSRAKGRAVLTDRTSATWPNIACCRHSSLYAVKVARCRRRIAKKLSE